MGWTSGVLEIGRSHKKFVPELTHNIIAGASATSHGRSQGIGVKSIG